MSASAHWALWNIRSPVTGNLDWSLVILTETWIFHTHGPLDLALFSPTVPLTTALEGGQPFMYPACLLSVPVLKFTPPDHYHCHPSPPHPITLSQHNIPIILCDFTLFIYLILLSRAVPVAYGSSSLGVEFAFSCRLTPQPHDPSHVFDLHHNSQQHQLLNPLSNTRDRTYILMVPSQIHFCCSTRGTLRSWFFRFNRTCYLSHYVIKYSKFTSSC